MATDDEKMIHDFIATHGVTKCRPGFGFHLQLQETGLSPQAAKRDKEARDKRPSWKRSVSAVAAYRTRRKNST